MSLPPALAANQILLFAVLSLGQRVARELGIRPDTPIAELTRRSPANRTYVYEVVDRVLAALEEMASKPAGRPKRERSSDDSAVPGLSLENRILRFRLDHPDACVEGINGRNTYSSRFRRFVLECHDGWQGCLEEFSEHARIPLDTVRDWLDADRKGLTPPIPEPKPPISVPCDATDLVRRIAELFAQWEGTTKDLIRTAASRFRLFPGQVARVLRILGCIRPYRRSNSRFRYRGSTEALAPGSVLVSDGTAISVALLGLNDDIVKVNWQGTVDQATGCHAAFVVTDEESADSLWAAHQEACAFLGRASLALLHDNKPCYDSCHDPSSLDALFFQPTELIAATPRRPENKAIAEGAFGLFEQQVGPLLVDATSLEALAQSVVETAVRCWAAGRDHSPHPDFDGKSRRQVLREFCPSPEQIERDRAFLRRLRSRHDDSRRPRLYQDSRRLLDHVFDDLGLLDKDPRAHLRTFLSRFSPDAIRRAVAVVAAKLARGAIDRDFLHRYLAKVIANKQDEIDLEVAEQELLRLCQIQRADWTAAAQAELALLMEQAPSPLQLAKSITEHAAFGALPVEGLFWTQALLEHLRDHLELLPELRRFLVRLYEAPFDRRLALLDKLAALQVGLL